MKDFNKLIVQGRAYTKNELLTTSNNLLHSSSWEYDFWQFVRAWLAPTPYVEVQTSGSTGQPKTILLEKSKMLQSAQMTCEYFALDQGQKALLCMSPKHIGGMMMVVRAFYAKLDLYVVKPQANPLKATEINFDFASMVPYQAQTIFNENPKKLKQVKKLLIGGGMLSNKLEEALVGLRINAYHSFGMTETISHFALRKLGTEDYFRCLPGISIKQAKNGTLQLKAPMFEDAIIETNDIIEYLSPTTFRWKGRLDFAIETGGVKVLPEVLEKELEKNIEQRFFITALPDEKLNNRVVLIIEGEKKNLPDNLFDNLPPYHRPKAVFFVDHFIETASGKIDRISTRARLIDPA